MTNRRLISLFLGSTCFPPLFFLEQINGRTMLFISSSRRQKRFKYAESLQCRLSKGSMCMSTVFEPIFFFLSSDFIETSELMYLF